jgi:hypothetical protein
LAEKEAKERKKEALIEKRVQEAIRKEERAIQRQLAKERRAQLTAEKLAAKQAKSLAIQAAKQLKASAQKEPITTPKAHKASSKKKRAVRFDFTTLEEERENVRQQHSVRGRAIKRPQRFL